MLALRMDTHDWATNFIPVWVSRLAEHVDHIDVLALEVGDPGPLPPNVRVYGMGKSEGLSRFGIASRFYNRLTALVPRTDAVFVHMIPRYAWMAAPITRLTFKPMTLWYTHNNLSRDLRWATPHLHRVVTAVPDSFPMKTKKLRVLGHGVDTTFFSPFSDESLDEPPAIVHVARLMPIKNQDYLLRALHNVPEARAVLVGSQPIGYDVDYVKGLRGIAPEGRAVFTGGLPANEVCTWYHRATIAVNLSPPGLFDKAALESMAAGVPTLVSNPAFDLGPHRDLLLADWPLHPDGIAAQLRAIISLSAEQRVAIGADLRARVVAQHSLRRLMPRLANVLRTGEPD